MNRRTVVVPNARHELLRLLVVYRDFHEKQVRDEGWDPDFCRLTPLFVGEWNNAPSDIMLAARECAALGEIEMADGPLCFDGPMVAITDIGYARIKAHDAIGESVQEAVLAGGES